MLTVVELFLPQPGEHLDILPKSAIVGSWDHDMRSVVLDYEGNRYGASNIVNFADRAHHAAGRHITRYPTVARRMAERGDFIQIGHYDTTFGECLLTLDGAERLAAWLEVERLQPELATTNARTQELRMVRGWTLLQRQQLRRLPATQRAIYEDAGLI